MEMLAIAAIQAIVVIPFLVQVIVVFSCFITLYNLLMCRAYDQFLDFEITKLWLSNRVWLSLMLGFIVCAAVRSDLYSFVGLLASYSIWLPQILSNTVRGGKEGPSLRRASIVQIQLVMPALYALSIKDNVLFFEPNVTMATLLLVWMLSQLILLKVQQYDPRFLIPRRLRPYLILGSDYYNYER